jgi:hypothetical protein
MRRWCKLALLVMSTPLNFLIVTMKGRENARPKPAPLYQVESL